MSDEVTGGCACGRVRYTAPIDNDEAYLCHCRMCQRATGSVSIAFKNVKKADVAWEQRARLVSLPRRSPGGPIAANAGRRSASLSRTARNGPDRRLVRRSVAFPADHHFGVESMHRAWINTEGLPEYRTDEYQPLVDRWMEKAWQAPRLDA